jgi:hypothetical protein
MVLIPQLPHGLLIDVKINQASLLSDQGTRDYPRGVLLLGYGMRHGSRPTSVVTTRSAVGLLIQ